MLVSYQPIALRMAYVAYALFQIYSLPSAATAASMHWIAFIALGSLVLYSLASLGQASSLRSGLRQKKSSGGRGSLAGSQHRELEIHLAAAALKLSCWVSIQASLYRRRASLILLVASICWLAVATNLNDNCPIARASAMKSAEWLAMTANHSGRAAATAAVLIDFRRKLTDWLTDLVCLNRDTSWTAQLAETLFRCIC